MSVKNTVSAGLGALLLLGSGTAGLIATTDAASAATTLKMWTLPFDETELKALNDVIASFEKANPDVEVKLETRGTDEHKTAMRLAIGSDQAPDIYFMWGGFGLGGEFVRAGASAPLDKEYAALGWDNRFAAAALTDSRRYGNERHGVPFGIHGEALYYNKALFAKAGISAPPQSYDELLADAAKLKAARIPAFTFGGSVNWHLMRLMDEILEAKCGAKTHDALTSMTVSWAKEPCADGQFRRPQDLDRRTTR